MGNNGPMRSVIAILIFTTCLGCAGLGKQQTAVNDVRPQVEANQQAAVERFEQKRIAAEMSAAQLRLDQGDLAGGLSILQAILDRTPAHRDARRLMSEVQLALGDSNAARETLQSLLRDDPHDALAHYQLATLYESIGNPLKAQNHAQQAYDIEPSNALYLLTLDEMEDAESLAGAPVVAPSKIGIR